MGLALDFLHKFRDGTRWKLHDPTLPLGREDTARREEMDLAGLREVCGLWPSGEHPAALTLSALSCFTLENAFHLAYIF